MAETKADKLRREAKPSRSMTLTTKWAAIALALITILFFHDVTIGGRTFVSSDGVAPAGFVRIGEQSLWHDHVYPLWNPFVFLGMPSFGSGAYNPLIYPPDWPMGLLQKTVPILPDMTWLLVYYFLGALFTFQLAKEWGARSEGAFFGAVMFMFAPNLVAVGAHGHGSQLVDSAYLPLMVWLTARWLRRGSLSDLGWLGLAGGFQFLRGHVQICFYTWMAIGLYAGVEVLAALREPRQAGAKLLRAVSLAFAAALAFGVAGFYNLPLKDYSVFGAQWRGWRRCRHGLRDAMVDGALRVAGDVPAQLGGFRRRHVLGRHAVHGLPERVRRRGGDPARDRGIRACERRKGYRARLRAGDGRVLGVRVLRA